MDSITHIVLGATIGEALAGKRLGKKAMLLGAVAQSLPDIDFITSSWMDTSRDVWAHRGITHSFLFVICMAMLLAFLADKWIRGSRMSAWDWRLFFGIQLLVHIVLDAFNAYGTGWFEPFSHYRVSFHVLYVADPLYSIWPGIAFLGLLISRMDSPVRKNWVRFGLILSSCYLCYCVTNKIRTDRLVQTELQRHQIAYNRYFTTPTPLNSWLWYIVAEDRQGFHIAYYSVFDRRKDIDFHFFPRNDSLLATYRGHEDVQNLLRFSQGYYTVDKWEGHLVFNDLRFGQIRGWDNGQAPFVFHYFLERPGDNRVIVQRGRLTGWNERTLRSFNRRVWGN